MRNIIQLLVLVLGCTAFAPSDSSAVELQAIMRDTQRSTKVRENFTMVWWMPQLYWQQSLAEAKQLSEEGKAQVLQLLSEYVMIAVVDGNFNAMGVLTPASEAEVASSLSITVQDEAVALIPESKLPDSMKNLLSGMRPVIQNGLGAVGKAMYIFVYPSGSKERGPWESRSGVMEIRYKTQRHKWRLPLACTLPDKVDSKTLEVFPGDFLFNPYTGDRLP